MNILITETTQKQAKNPLIIQNQTHSGSNSIQITQLTQQYKKAKTKGSNNGLPNQILNAGGGH